MCAGSDATDLSGRKVHNGGVWIEPALEQVKDRDTVESNRNSTEDHRTRLDRRVLYSVFPGRRGPASPAQKKAAANRPARLFGRRKSNDWHMITSPVRLSAESACLGFWPVQPRDECICDRINNLHEY